MIVVANCVHLLATLQQRLRAGDSKRDAIVEAVRLNLHPVFLASLTTTLGFLSMNFSEVPPYRHLGNFVAIGIAASFILSVTFLPAVLSLLPMRAPKKRRWLRGPSMTVIADFVLRHRKTLMVGWLVIVVGMAVGIPRNELNDVLVHFFDESVEFRQDIDFMDEHLSGNTLLEYSLHAPAEGGVTDPEFLADVSNFAAWYRDQPPVRHVAVITDTFRQLNQSMRGDDPAAYRIPESQELAAQYLLLYELSLPQGLNLNNQIDRSRSATRVSVSAETLSSQELLDLNAHAEAWLRENAPHVAGVNSTGPAALFAYIGQRNIRAMLIGTGVVLLAISAILLFALRSLRLGLISIVPNLVPAVLGLGVWGLAVGQVSLSLSVVVAMTVGIVVDDTVHFLSKYRRARREFGQDPEDAVRYAFDTSGRALITTTIVLVAGFPDLRVFSLRPHRRGRNPDRGDHRLCARCRPIAPAGALDDGGPESRKAGPARALICTAGRKPANDFTGFGRRRMEALTRALDQNHEAESGLCRIPQAAGYEAKSSRGIAIVYRGHNNICMFSTG